ncbi:MAG: GNAT family N-acetyltransferase [Opitutae bacterium]|nr:GNAT family N-acetyltransferase [Opitutae bacterium]
MLTINRRLKGLRIREIYFAADLPVREQGCDILQLVQCAVPPGPQAIRFHSSIVNIDREEEALLAGLSKNCRYEVRRAQDKDGLECEVLERPDETALAVFRAAFSEFARTTGIAPANNEKLVALHAAAALTLSTVRREGAILAQHVYLHDARRTRLLYSHSAARGSDDSARRALIGRANRLLHWRDMLAFKARGFEAYDLGGIAHTAELAGIDRFKMEFGGEPTMEWNGFVGAGPLGQFALAARTAAIKARGLVRPRVVPPTGSVI